MLISMFLPLPRVRSSKFWLTVYIFCSLMVISYILFNVLDLDGSNLCKFSGSAEKTSIVVVVPLETEIFKSPKLNVWAGRLSPEERSSFPLKPHRNIWTQVARGGVTLNGTSLNAGDGAAITDESTLEIKTLDHTEILVFDLT